MSEYSVFKLTNSATPNVVVYSISGKGLNGVKATIKVALGSYRYWLESGMELDKAQEIYKLFKHLSISPSVNILTKVKDINIELVKTFPSKVAAFAYKTEMNANTTIVPTVVPTVVPTLVPEVEKVVEDSKNLPGLECLNVVDKKANLLVRHLENELNHLQKERNDLYIQVLRYSCILDETKKRFEKVQENEEKIKELLDYYQQS